MTHIATFGVSVVTDVTVSLSLRKDDDPDWGADYTLAYRNMKPEAVEHVRKIVSEVVAKLGQGLPIETLNDGRIVLKGGLDEINAANQIGVAIVERLADHGLQRASEKGIPTPKSENAKKLRKG